MLVTHQARTEHSWLEDMVQCGKKGFYGKRQVPAISPFQFLLLYLHSFGLERSPNIVRCVVTCVWLHLFSRAVVMLH